MIFPADFSPLSVSPEGEMQVTLVLISDKRICNTRSWKMEDFGHERKRKCAQVGQRAYPCWATCLPHLGKVRAQKRDKTRLKATVNGEEWQVPDAGTKDWISRKSKRHTRNSTPTATRFSVYTWDSTCRWANTTLTKATCSRPPPERRLQHPAPGEPWQQGVYAHHDTGS